MIDTLKIRLGETNIKSKNDLIHVPPSHQGGLVFNDFDLYKTQTGKIVSGSKAYYNSDYFNLNLKPFPPELKKDHVLNADISVQLSLPKYNSLLNNKPALNLNPVDQDEQVKIFRDLNERLFKIGITTDISDASLSRLDTFTNISLDHSYLNYADIFKTYHLPRKVSYTYASETFLFKNNQGEICVYDKNLDIKNKVGIDLQSNTLRIENRIFKKKNIFNRCNIFNLNELVQNQDSIKQDYFNIIGESFFKEESRQSFSQWDENIMIEALTVWKNTFPSARWYNDFLRVNGIVRWVVNSGEDVVIKALKDFFGDTQTGKRTFRRARKMVYDSRWAVDIVMKPVNDRYVELKEKFLKLAA